MKIQEYLTESGIKRSFISKKINVSYQVFCRIVRGAITPSLKTALDIEKATNGKVTVYDWID